MKAITIHPENPEQLKAVKSMLKALKIPFENQMNEIPPALKESINKGLQQINEGEFIEFKEFKEKFLQ